MIRQLFLEMSARHESKRGADITLQRDVVGIQISKNTPPCRWVDVVLWKDNGHIKPR
jgi:hypothetical protein